MYLTGDYTPTCGAKPEPESVGKKTLRLLCVLGVSAVRSFWSEFHRRDAKSAELAQRKSVFPTDSTRAPAQAVLAGNRRGRPPASPRAPQPSPPSPTPV